MTRITFALAILVGTSFVAHAAEMQTQTPPTQTSQGDTASEKGKKGTKNTESQTYMTVKLENTMISSY
jgi:Spy/CpxP family protein refolding chaperone